MNKKEIKDNLIKKGNYFLQASLKEIREILSPTQNKKADELIDNIRKYPHAFVLASLMDRQIRAERAWLIPYEISKRIGGFEFLKLLSHREKIKEIFYKEKIHRMYNKMAEIFDSAIEKIHRDYENDVSKIWHDEPSSCTVIRKFLEFKGCGRKIATMATNILVREHKIKMKDHHCIDISPDRHIRRVFKRLGFISEKATDDEIIYCARELNPQYPGIIDLPAFEIGRNWCHPRSPDCKNCYLNKYCPKII